MKSIFLNNFRRLMKQKSLVVLLIIFTTAATVAAIFISNGLTQTWDVIVVSQQEEMPFNRPGLNVAVMKSGPVYSELVTGKYDAIIYVDEDGTYQIDTIKSEEATMAIVNLLDGNQESAPNFSNRGTGTNILGYLMMFLLLMGSMAMCMFSDDKEQKQITRVAASPIAMSTYLFAHCLFNFCFLFIPTMCILHVVKWISGADFGYNLIQLASMIGLICAFSTAFCLLLYTTLSNKADSAKMTGNTIIILTSILAGNFYAFDKGNNALGMIIKILPQKAYLNIAEGLEQGMPFTNYLLSILYLILLTVAFYLIAIVKTKREYVNCH